MRPRRLGRVTLLLTAVSTAIATSLTLGSTPAGAQGDNGEHGHAYAERLLVTDQATSSPVLRDPNLKNPWGIAFGYAPTATPLWVANEGTSTSTLYSGGTDTTPAVTKVPLTVTTQPSPTGVVFNRDPSAFLLPDGRSARFIFASLSGQIAGWAPPPPPTSTTTMITEPGAVLTGLAVGATSTGSRLYAADAAAGVVRMYDAAWHPIGMFTDDKAPPGLAPYNVAVLHGRVFVTFAPPEGVEPTIAGAVSVFTANGRLLSRLVRGNGLHGPWGLAIAPADWGRFGGDLLVGNEDGGLIHAYDLRTGELRGTVRDVTGRAIAHDGLWGMQFGNGVIGTPQDLITVAGINGYADGVVTAIRPVRGDDD